MKNLPKIKKELATETLKLLAENNIKALPMKLYSDDDDVDIVIIDKNQYTDASNILKSKGWYIKNNRSKLRERDKDFFKNKKYPYVIHLHKAFSWNTVPYLDSKKLWEGKREVSGLLLPSIEDELLIISAHSLFENQHIKPEEIVYGQGLLQKDPDFNYIRVQARNFHWEKGVNIVLEKLKNYDSSLSITDLLSIKISKLSKDFIRVSPRQFLTEFINYFAIDWIWNYRLLLKGQLKRGPVIISLSGVDGSGKSTQLRFLQKLLSQKNKQVKTVHVGKTLLVKSDNSEKGYKIWGTVYLSFFKDFLGIIYSLLTNYKSDVIVFDRYIFDTLVKNAYKDKNEKINNLLIPLSRLLPNPNLSFLLLASGENLSERDMKHSQIYYESKVRLYNTLPTYFPNIKSIDANVQEKEVSRALEKSLNGIKL